MFKLSTILEEMEKYTPEILSSIDHYENLPSISIDYAVMEKTGKLTVVPVDCGWNDFGSWDAVYSVLDKDKDNNALKGDVLTYNTKNSLVYSTSRKVATVGIKDILVVETDDAVLVCHKDHAQDVKEIVEQLRVQLQSAK